MALLRRSKATYSYGTRQSRQPQPEPDVDPNTAEIRLRDVNSAEANALQNPYSIRCTDLQIVSHYFSSKDYSNSLGL